MFKKRLNGGVMYGFVWLLSAVFLSCSEKELDVTGGKEITTSVTVEVPEVFRTRAVPAVYPTNVKNYLGESGYPSIGNVDLKEHPLTFTVGVYVEKTVDGNTEYVLIDKQSRSGVMDDKADFNFRLMEGQQYRIVAYADFSDNEQENLDNISIVSGLNDELKDAFFVSQNFTASDNLTVVLKRPFGKLRLIARDFSTIAVREVFEIEEIKVTYGETATALATNSFNAITGKFNEITEGVTREFTASPVVYAKEYEGDTPYAAVFTMYLPANFGTGESDYSPVEPGTPVPQSWMYPFDIEVTYKNGVGTSTTIKRSFNIDIPVKRNWLTTIDAANFWTVNSNITVSIDHRFEGFIKIEPKTYMVMTETELREAVKAIEATQTRTGKIILGTDITLTSENEGLELGYYNSSSSSPVVAPYKSESIILDLNGHRLNSTTVPKWTKAVIGIYGPVTLIIEDTSADANGVIESPLVKNAEGKDESCQTIIAWRYGSKIIVNGGKIISHHSWNTKYTDLEAIYLANPINYVGKKSDGGLELVPSTLTITTGWFECAEIDEPECLINLFNGGKDLPPHPDDIGYGLVWVKGGSFVGFNPANGDNVSGTVKNKWVDDDHIVLTETVDGRTVYTVVPKKSPEDYD
jgi:lipoprotein